MKAIFEPRSVAFIGASSDLFKWGFNILHHIIERGYAGKIHPVNPNGGTWFGRKVFPMSMRSRPLWTWQSSW